MSGLDRKLSQGHTRFLVNSGDFPLDEIKWDQMIKFAIHTNPRDKYNILKLNNLIDVPNVEYPYLPTLRNSMKNELKIIYVQEFINTLQYNFTGTQFFSIDKSLSIINLMDRAQTIIKESLPIKCLEALLVALYLTNGFDDLFRFPISFMTLNESIEHRHIVLGVYSQYKFGCIGLSRRTNLMFKPLKFDNLYELLEDYRQSYSIHNHQLVEVTMGNAIPHRFNCVQTINWKALTISFVRKSALDIEESLFAFCKNNRMFPKGDNREISRMKMSNIISKAQMQKIRYNL